MERFSKVVATVYSSPGFEGRSKVTWHQNFTTKTQRPQRKKLRRYPPGRANKTLCLNNGFFSLVFNFVDFVSLRGAFQGRIAGGRLPSLPGGIDALRARRRPRQALRRTWQGTLTILERVRTKDKK